MKKYLLLASLFIGLAAKSQDLINNYGFDNWATDTFILTQGQIVSSWPADTVLYLDPVGWTSSNTISDLDSFQNILLVTPDNSPQSGTYDIKMRTSIIKLPITLYNNYAGLASDSIVLPGFAVSGHFPLTTNSLASSGLTNNLNPGDIIGAGQPFTQRLASISGYFQYNPVYDSITHANDTCLIYAVLRQGTNDQIASAIFKSNAATSGWQPFTANFTYFNCDVPDTLVILISSSIPNPIKILQGISSLTPGSQFFVDSLWYDTLPNSYVFPVWPVADLDTVLENSTNNLIDVTSNDRDCNSLPLVASIVSGPLWGTASVANDSSISYTPTANYSGYDTIIYSSHNAAGDSANAQLTIYVRNPNAINNVNELTMRVYPVPASSQLNVNFENPGKTNARVYDMLGKLVESATFTANYNQLDIAALEDGMYSIELLNTDNVVVARSKFNVIK